jgi:hypothetical protein
MMRVLGRAASLEILLEGRIWGAREAYEKGLVNRVVPDASLAEEGDASARRIAQGAPLVARWHKKFIRRLSDPRPLSAEEQAESYACFDTEDFRTGVRAFLAKEKPASAASDGHHAVVSGGLGARERAPPPRSPRQPHLPLALQVDAPAWQTSAHAKPAALQR